MSFLDAMTAAMGMTTDRWMQLPVHELPVTSLTPTQWVNDLRPASEPNEVSSGDPVVHVVRLGSVFYVQDGHHRLARARLRHDEKIPARLLVLTT